MRIRASLLGMALFASCASGQPETGLDPALYQNTQPVIGEDPRGLSFVVFPSTTVPTWVKITQDGRSHLAWMAQVDDRTAMLVPVSAFSPKKDAQIQPLSTPEFEGIGIGEGEQVRWTGPGYEGPVAVLPEQLSRTDLTNPWVVAVGTVKNNRLENVSGNLPGRYLVVPQPVHDAPCQFVVLDDLPLQVNGCQKQPTSNVAWTRGATTFHAAPLFTRLNVDIAAWQLDDTYFTSVSTPVTVNGLPLAAVAEPWPVKAPGLLSAAATGQWAVQAGQPLIAAYWLTHASSDHATRISDLYAAAGRGTWAQISLTVPRNGLTPETSLALARAALIEDRLEDAQAYAQLAFDESTRLYEPASGLVRGQAAGILALVAANQSRPELAAQWARKAAESYAEVGDDLRAASMELEAAGWWARAGDLAAAQKNASDARSRFFHGGAIWHSARAESRLAELTALQGDVQEASKLATYAVERFSALGDPIAATQAKLVQHFVAGERLAIEEYMNAGLASGDAVLARDAASLLTLLNLKVEESPNVVAALAKADHLDVDAVGRFRISQAWRAVCALGPALSPGDEAAAVYARRCSRSPQDAAAATVDRVLLEGFEALNDRDIAAARRNLQAAQELAGNDPNAKRQTRVLEASIVRAAGEDVETFIARTAADMTATTEPALMARSLGQLATDAAEHGQNAVAVDFLDEAIIAATRAGQLDERRDHALFRIELLHQDRRYNDVIVAATQSQKWFESAGVRGISSLVRSSILAHDAARRLGQTPQPLVLDTLPADQAGAAHLQLAEHAYLRSDFVEAQTWIARADDSPQVTILRTLIQASQDFNSAGIQAIDLVKAGATHPDLVDLALARARTAEEFAELKGVLTTPEGKALAALREGTQPETPTTQPCLAAWQRLQSGASMDDRAFDDAEICEALSSPSSLQLRAMWGDDLTHDLYRRQAELSRDFRPVATEARATELTRREEAVTAARTKGGAALKKAFREWITYEMAIGRAADAVKHIDEASAMVLELAPDAQTEIALLRLNAMAAANQWGPAFQHGLRIMAEAKLEGNDGAELALTAARVALVVGAREVARSWLVTAADLVRKNPPLARRIQATAESFFLVP